MIKVIGRAAQKINQDISLIVEEPKTIPKTANQKINRIKENEDILIGLL